MMEVTRRAAETRYWAMVSTSVVLSVGSLAAYAEMSRGGLRGPGIEDYG